MLMEARMHPLMRWINLLVVTPCFALLGGYILLMSVIHGASPFVSIGAISILMFGFYGQLAELRYRLMITDSFVEQTHWRTVRIDYKEIERVILNRRTVVLETKRKRLVTLGVVEDRDRVFRLLAQQFREIPGVVYSGDRRIIQEFLRDGKRGTL